MSLPTIIIYICTCFMYCMTLYAYNKADNSAHNACNITNLTTQAKLSQREDICIYSPLKAQAAETCNLQWMEHFIEASKQLYYETSERTFSAENSPASPIGGEVSCDCKTHKFILSRRWFNCSVILWNEWQGKKLTSYMLVSRIWDQAQNQLCRSRSMNARKKWDSQQL